MWSFVITLFCVITLMTTVTFLFISHRTIEFIPKSIENTFGVVTFLYLIVILLGGIGDLARGEQSPFPWQVFIEESSRHGMFNGIIALFNSIILSLWIFIIPGHLYSGKIYIETKNIIFYPYIVNILVGIILSSEHNVFYKLILWFSD